MMVILGLTAGLFFTDFRTFPDAMLEDLGLYQIGYGFFQEGQLYLGYSTQLIGIDAENKNHWLFQKEGMGPNELDSGGPIFGIGDHTFCVDIRGRKLMQFSKSLQLQRSRSFDLVEGIAPYFLTGPKGLFSIACLPESSGLQIRKWITASLEPGKATNIKLPFDDHFMPLSAAFLEDGRLIVAEKYQFEEEFQIFLVDLSSKEVNSFSLFNKDYDPDAPSPKKRRRAHLIQALKYSTALRAFGSDGNFLYVFVTNLDPQGKHASYEANYSVLTVDRTNWELTEIKDIAYSPVSGQHFGSPMVFKHEDGGVMVANPAFISNQP